MPPSTHQLTALPDAATLRRICKALSVLDAIICQDWEFRYYSYQQAWGEGEEFCERRDGEGNHTLILFTDSGCVINGFDHEHDQPDKAQVTAGLPTPFHEFIFGEPVRSIGTTFCIWTDDAGHWTASYVSLAEDGSADALALLDGRPQSYIDWATGYYEGDITPSDALLATVTRIYNGEPLTKAMVLSIVEEVEDWDQLADDLAEIGYPFLG
jgi:hypothetical protein